MSPSVLVVLASLRAVVYQNMIYCTRAAHGFVSPNSLLTNTYMWDFDIRCAEFAYIVMCLEIYSCGPVAQKQRHHRRISDLYDLLSNV